MPPTLRIGIVGLGRAATSMLPSLANHPDVRLTAAADLRSEAREKFRTEFKAATFESVEELCSSPQVDAVYIATPHEFHAEHVITAVRYGKHAIVEKPMALTLADCEEMIRAADRADIRLLVGHTHSFDPPVLKMRELVRSGELGRLGMINTFNYTDFLYRPRRPEELDTARGGGIVFNQVPHQVDIVRLIGGGLVRSVRAMVGRWDPARPTEGSLAAFLEFNDGTPATIVYSGYDHFSTDELHFWIGEGGDVKKPDQHGQARGELASIQSPEEEAALKAATGYGGARQKRATLKPEAPPAHHPHFGITIVSCERGDLRASADGVFVYDSSGKREISVPLGRAVPDKGKVIDEFYDAVVSNVPLVHDGHWGRATLEVCLAMLESAREKREIVLQHQVAR